MNVIVVVTLNDCRGGVFVVSFGTFLQVFKKRELIVLVSLFSNCRVAVSGMRLFIVVPCVGL